jgi:cytochrome c biogenesis protein CcdA
LPSSSPGSSSPPAPACSRQSAYHRLCGGYSEGNEKKAALYSLVFIFGLSITFTLLGVAASLMGGFFGFMGRGLYIGLAVIAVTMGLQLIGLI